MVQIFVLSTAYGAMTAAGAIDAGVIPPSDLRILLSVNAAVVPETADDFIDAPHLAGVRGRFDRIESLNELVAPLLPTRWEARADDLPFLERLLRRAWGIGDDVVELFLQTPQAPPARTLAAVFSGAPLTIVGDGLMTYAPIRTRVPYPIAGRVVSVAYVDVLPGVEPVLFSEVGATRAPIPVAALQSVLDEVAAGTTDDAVSESTSESGPRTALVLGQYLAALGILSDEEERRTQQEMIDVAIEWGAERVVFKPHPAAPPGTIDGLRAHAAVRGVALDAYDGVLPAEALAARLGTMGVVAGFSSALPTVRALSGVRIDAVGTELLLRRLTPYANSNRIPVTIIDALTRTDSPYRDSHALQQLVDAVAYAMQPEIAVHLRERAVEFLATAPASERDRYFPARRLRELRLVDGRAAGGPSNAYTYGDQARLAAAGIRRRLGRAWKVLRGA